MDEENTPTDPAPLPDASATPPVTAGSGDPTAASEQPPVGWEQLWDQLQGELTNSFTTPDASAMFSLFVSLVVGGLLAMYLRFLYRRTSAQIGADSIAKVFPMLTIVTIAVIAVVQSSLALSLGLVGALSIVRFRAAIKDPEELVYLFLCIGVGLALGASQAWVALALVIAATIFVLLFDRLRPGAGTGEAYLTVVGDATGYFSGEDRALSAVRNLCPHLTVQRCDIDGDEGQLRVLIHRSNSATAPTLVSQLRTRLPGCQISYVNGETAL